MVVRKFMEENIKKRMPLIMDAWDVSSNIVSFGSWINAYNEFIQEDYKHGEEFYKDAFIKFAIKVSNMTKLKMREEDFISPSKMKQLIAWWVKRLVIWRTLWKTAMKL